MNFYTVDCYGRNLRLASFIHETTPYQKGTFLPLTVLLTSLPSTVTSFVSIPSLTSTVVVCSLPFTILDVVVTETEDDRRDRGDPVGDPVVSDWRPRGQGVVVVEEI